MLPSPSTLHARCSPFHGSGKRDIRIYSAKLPDKNYDVDGVMNDLVSYKRRPEDLSDKIAPTFGAIVEITGKSINTMFNGHHF